MLTNVAEILLPVTRSRHQPDRNALLKEWLHIHASYPYPTGAEIEAFAQADGRTKHQIQVAFRNLRQRMDAPCPKDLLPYEASGFSPIQTSDVASQNIESLSMSQDCSGDGFSFSEGEVTWSNYPWSYDFLNATIEDNTTWHQIEQDRTDITCTSSSSPSNADNKAMLQAAAPKRKGKKRHALRSDPINSQQQHDVDVNTNHDDKKEKAQSAQQYQCTTCRQSFSKPFDWRRHEEGVHWHIDTLWICKLHETTILGTHCIFCSDLILDLYHLEEHDIQVCDADHRFSRKDLLKQHVQQVHLKTSRAAVRRGFSVPLSWISPVGAGDVVPNALWCGFCMLEFEFVEERMEHVKHHFKAGSSMEFWMAKDQL